jgi:Cys-rich protein (TIGR01571 family)
MQRTADAALLRPPERSVDPIQWDGTVVEKPKWSTDICDCNDDCGGYCFALWCPCVVFGQNSEAALNKNAALDGFGWCMLTPIFNWLFGGTRRTAIRVKYNIEGDGCEDVCCHFWCTSCVLAQETREINLQEKTAEFTTQGGVRVTVRTPASVASASTGRYSRPRVRGKNNPRPRQQQQQRPRVQQMQEASSSTADAMAARYVSQSMMDPGYVG